MSMKIDATCPECGHFVDDAAAVRPEGIDVKQIIRPTPGDLAICIQCAGIGIYVEKEEGVLGLRLPTVAEKVELSQDEHVAKVRASIIFATEGWT